MKGVAVAAAVAVLAGCGGSSLTSDEDLPVAEAQVAVAQLVSISYGFPDERPADEQLLQEVAAAMAYWETQAVSLRPDGSPICPRGVVGMFTSSLTADDGFSPIERGGDCKVWLTNQSAGESRLAHANRDSEDMRDAAAREYMIIRHGVGHALGLAHTVYGDPIYGGIMCAPPVPNPTHLTCDGYEPNAQALAYARQLIVDRCARMDCGRIVPPDPSSSWFRRYERWAARRDHRNAVRRARCALLRARGSRCVRLRVGQVRATARMGLAPQ